MEEGKKLKRYARRKGNLPSFELELHQIHRKIGVAIGLFRICLYCLTWQEFNLILTLRFMSLRVQLCNWDQSKLN